MNKDLKLNKTEIFKDKRGDLSEIYRKKTKDKFNFIIQTTSKNNVFRGFHFQRKFQQAKYIYLLKGEIIDIAINLKKKSKYFGKVSKFKLKPGYSLFIPKGYAHGYYTCKKENIVLYIMDNFQKTEYEDGINIFDKKFKFSFKKKKFTISTKDKKWQSFEEFSKNIKSL